MRYCAMVLTETFSQELPLRPVEKSVEKIRVNWISF
jgi:hypothetical protein